MRLRQENSNLRDYGGEGGTKTDKLGDDMENPLKEDPTKEFVGEYSVAQIFVLQGVAKTYGKMELLPFMNAMVEFDLEFVESRARYVLIITALPFHKRMECFRDARPLPTHRLVQKNTNVHSLRSRHLQGVKYREILCR